MLIANLKAFGFCEADLRPLEEGLEQFQEYTNQYPVTLNGGLCGLQVSSVVFMGLFIR